MIERDWDTGKTEPPAARIPATAKVRVRRQRGSHGWATLLCGGNIWNSEGFSVICFRVEGVTCKQCLWLGVWFGGGWEGSEVGPCDGVADTVNDCWRRVDG